MVEKLLQNNGTYEIKMNRTNSFEEPFSTPLFTPSTNTPTTSTPFESCNVWPVESCQVSRELHPDEYLQDFLEEKGNNQTGEDDQKPKKSWSKRLKLIKQSGLNSKLKASRAYLKYFFTKSSCSDLTNVNESMVPKAEIISKRGPFGQIQESRHLKTSSFKKEDNVGNEKGYHRRSFSAALKRTSSSKYISSESSFGSSSSASSSNNSNGFRDMHFSKKRIIINLEADNPIQAAIAHCKKF